MQNPQDTPTWLVYERCVAAFTFEENSSINVTVQPNVNIIGKISGVKRQIDVLIDSRWEDGVDRRIIVDAKNRKRKVDVKDIESFEGMMKDCSANRGVIVCSSGYTEAALKRAQDAISITILGMEELADYGWTYEPCLDRCQERKPSTRGMVLWASSMGLATSYEDPILMIQTGKCDGCHSFHIWCWGCGLKFPVSDNSIYRCDCGQVWIAYTNEGKDAIYLAMVADQDHGVIIDRRPIF